MPTFTHEVSPYKRRDGTYLIKYRVTHNRKTLRKPSGIYASASQLTKDRTRIKDQALLDIVNEAVGRLRMEAARVVGAEFLSASQLWDAIKGREASLRGFSCDFYAFADTFIASKEKGTQAGYIYALRALRKYTGKDTLDVNAIDKALVNGFRSWIEKRNGKGCRASSAYLEKLRAIHNAARERYNDDDTGLVRIPRQPFKGTIPAQPQTRHKALTLTQLRKVIFSTPTTSRGLIARDVFALSFYLIGMNTADLYALRRDDLRDGVLTYRRAKTDSRRSDKAEMRVRVEPEAAAIIASYPGAEALLSFSERYATFNGFNWSVNKGLKEVGILAGVPDLTTYHARHTWATLARNECGIGKDTVAEALNHAGGTVTDIYLARDFTRVWEANRAVLDLLK